MGYLLRLPVIRTLHKRQLLFPTVILIVVAGVLVQGALDRNQRQRMTSESAEPAVVPEARPILRGDLEKTPLTYFSDFWNQLAEGARSNLVLVGPTATPGVLIGPRLVLTTVQPALAVVAERSRIALTREEPEDAVAESEADEADPDEAEPDGGGGDTVEPVAEEANPHRLRAWNEELGLALFDIDDADGTGFTLSDPRRLPSGSYLGAVTLDGDGAPTVTPGYLVTTVAEADTSSGGMIVSMDLASTLSVAAIIDLDGAMVGLAYDGGAGRRVVTTTEMLGLIESLQTQTVCRSIEVSDLDDDIRRLLGVESGVLIEYVRPEAFTQEPSLRGGDVLLEWGDTPLESTEQFASLFDAQTPGSLVRYRVLRGRRRVTGGTIMPARNCAPVTSEPVRLSQFGLAVQWADRAGSETMSRDGWYVVAVAREGSAAAAGVRERDYLRSVDGQGVEDEDDRPILEAAAVSEEAFVLSLLRDGRPKLIAMSPAAGDEPEAVLAEGEIESDR